jgi:ubiquinone/menaquinone biosynthesis C-methylase UbiE
MNDAKLYADSNDLQRRDAKDLINEFKHFFANIQNAKILDIGTGTGDVFVEILLPSLKYKPIQVIGTDKSQEMIRFSSEKCRSESIQLIFKELNIESDFLNDETLEWKIESFDLITSFYCQQWIQDQW